MKKCKQCGELLVAKREDALYCNDNCRQKNFKRRKKVKTSIIKIGKDFIFNAMELKKLVTKFNHGESYISEKIKLLKQEVLLIGNDIEKKKKELSLKPNEFRRYFWKEIQKDPKQFRDYAHIIRNAYPNHVRDPYLDERRYVIKNELAILIRKLKNHNLRISAQQNKLNLFNKDEIKRIYNKLKTENKTLKKQIIELQQIDLDDLPTQSVRKKVIPSIDKKRSPSLVNAYSGREILTMNFDGVTLGGNLGKFLGKLQRVSCAIVLTGDSGAGKTWFSYELANVFLEKQLSVGYFSLESGFTEDMQKQIKFYGFDTKKFQAYGQANLEELRDRVAFYDCVIIDSFNKIATKAQEFENLRKDFPDVYFIIIFQKTNKGSVRGGAAILFDSSAKIDIKVSNTGERIAYMEKSRYGTENFLYSISKKQLLKADKLPVDWKKAAEKWGVTHP